MPPPIPQFLIIVHNHKGQPKYFLLAFIFFLAAFLLIKHIFELLPLKFDTTATLYFSPPPLNTSSTTSNKPQHNISLISVAWSNSKSFVRSWHRANLREAAVEPHCVRDRQWCWCPWVNEWEWKIKAAMATLVFTPFHLLLALPLLKAY
jgi:hypothetical protein